MFNKVYSGKKVLVTGHTGFKGSWMSQWLLNLGAEVYGISLDPDSEINLYDQLQLSEKLTEDHRIDIRNKHQVKSLIESIKPDFLFHMAAQSLVRLSYNQPIETYEVNVMGTAHLLESLRTLEKINHKCVAVFITTDKSYENKEWLYSYRENDPIGGYDPYSSSKGCAELLIASYRRSYFSNSKYIKLASARAGNVIGGGDWALDRIVPDCIRAYQKNVSIVVRNKQATRPWQHVLEPISGYLWLAACIANYSLKPKDLETELLSAFNFGPELSSNRSVCALTTEIVRYLGNTWIDNSRPEAIHEASKLNLAIDKAFHLLDWQPVWGFEETIEKTATWYVEVHQKIIHPMEKTLEQIAEYQSAAQLKSIKWAS